MVPFGERIYETMFVKSGFQAFQFRSSPTQLVRPCASAAGVSLLALVQPSEAKIVYTKSHHVIGTNVICGLDLHNGSELTCELKIRRGFGRCWFDSSLSDVVHTNLTPFWRF